MNRSKKFAGIPFRYFKANQKLRLSTVANFVAPGENGGRIPKGDGPSNSILSTELNLNGRINLTPNDLAISETGLYHTFISP